MKIEKWETAPLPAVALKLCEEAGEVAKEFAYMGNPVYPADFKTQFARTIEELDHVLAIATMLKARLTTELKSGRLFP